MPDDLTIRPARPSDLSEITEIIVERHGGEPERWRARLEQSLTRACVSEPADLILVATIPARIAGYAKTNHFSPPPDAPANVAPAGWYLSGVIVRPEFRRRGIGSRLTRARLAWIRQRADRAYYFANIRNRVSIELHDALGFVEETRDFWFPQTSFEGGVGVLYSCDLSDTRA